MGHYGQSHTPGQGQDSGRYPTESNVTAILRVVGGSSRVAAILGVIDEQSHRREYLLALSFRWFVEPLGPFSPVRPLPYTPLFSLNSLNSLPPSRIGHYGQSQTPGQGQDNGRYPIESNVTGITTATGCNTFWAF